jgi:P2-related tail formation protein
MVSCALGSVKAFVKEIKKLLPYLRIDKSVDEWMKEH